MEDRIKKMEEGCNVEDGILQNNVEDKRLLIELYKIIIEKPKNQISVLQQYRHLLDRPITINVRSRCTCINLFEQHPLRNLDPTDPIYTMIFSWIQDGQCRCYDIIQPSTFAQKSVRKKLIHVAVAVGNEEVVKYLLSQGCNINDVTDWDKFSPLFLAIMNNSVHLVQYLIENGADVNRTSRYECNTPLMEAMLTQKKEIFDILLNEPSIDINACNLRSETILTIAVRVKKRSLIPLLVGKGANINHVDHTGFTPLIHAVLEEDAKLVQVLIENGADINKTEGQGETPLHIAVHNEAKGIVRMLLENGADPNVYTNDVYSPILISSYSQSNDMLEVLLLLLDHKADVDSKNKEEYTALHISAWNGFLETVKILLSYGAKLEMQTLDKNTPLTLAAHGKHLHVLEYLLPLGCDVNTQDKDLDTAIHYAAYNGDSDSVRFLLRNGARADVRNRLNVTPLWNAVYSNSIDVVKLLIKQNVELETPSVGIDQHAQVMGVVCIYDVPKSPLWVAAEKGYSEMAMLLLAAGYNIHQENWLKDTESLPKYLEKNHDFHDLLIYHYNTPPRLVARSRDFFRKYFHSKVGVKALLLPLPSALKSYITLKDIL